MKIGILVVFRNAEKEIHIEELIKVFTNTHAFEICLVNNGSSDATLQRLHKIKEYLNTSIAVIDIKKRSGHNAAIKAGVQHLKGTKDLAYVLCLQKFSRNDTTLLEHIITLVEQQKDVLANVLKRTKRIVHRNVFSVSGLLEEVS